MKIRGVPGFERPLSQWTLVLLAVIIVVLAGLVLRRDRGMQLAVVQLEHERDAAHASIDKLEGALAHERAAREAFELSLGRERTGNLPASIALKPGLDPRGRPTQEIRIPRDVARVQFVLPINGRRYPRYRAVIRAFTSGDELWSHAALLSDAAATRVIVTVPTEVIASGAYGLRLEGLDDKGQAQLLAPFTFEVVRN